VELAETIDTINRQLRTHFSFDDQGQQIWRVVWSEDQYEKRIMDVTDEGLALLTPEVRIVPKYKQWIKERYVLERLVLVPMQHIDTEMTTVKSYEPIWTFEVQVGPNVGDYIAPKFEACKFIIDTIYAAQGKKSMKRYVDTEKANPVEARMKRIDKISEQLFGNETPATDALAYGTGVVVPHPMKEN